MPEPDPRIDAFFAGGRPWRAELSMLRTILLGCGLSEVYKWRGPCYTAAGGNIATLWGLKDRCALAFFKGVLLKDRRGILVAPGAHSRSVRLVEFTDAAQVSGRKDILKDYVAEAIEIEKSGEKVQFTNHDLDPPQELVDALCADPALDAAFKALSPGRQRGYMLHVARAKQPATRRSRIEKAAPRILQGKGMHDR